MHAIADKGMHGLKEASTLAHEELRQHLEQYGHHPNRHTTTLFTLVVDDFGVKHLTK